MRELKQYAHCTQDTETDICFIPNRSYANRQFQIDGSYHFISGPFLFTLLSLTQSHSAFSISLAVLVSVLILDLVSERVSTRKILYCVYILDCVPFSGPI